MNCIYFLHLAQGFQNFLYKVRGQNDVLVPQFFLKRTPVFFKSCLASIRSIYPCPAQRDEYCVYIILSITMLLVDVWNGFLEALNVQARNSKDFWLVNCRAATPEMADSRDNILTVN